MINQLLMPDATLSSSSSLTNKPLILSMLTKIWAKGYIQMETTCLNASLNLEIKSVTADNPRDQGFPMDVIIFSIVIFLGFRLNFKFEKYLSKSTYYTLLCNS